MKFKSKTLIPFFVEKGIQRIQAERAVLRKVPGHIRSDGVKLASA
jgi:hypothetical protein